MRGRAPASTCVEAGIWPPGRSNELHRRAASRLIGALITTRRAGPLRTDAGLTRCGLPLHGSSAAWRRNGHTLIIVTHHNRRDHSGDWTSLLCKKGVSLFDGPTEQGLTPSDLGQVFVGPVSSSSKAQATSRSPACTVHGTGFGITPRSPPSADYRGDSMLSTERPLRKRQDTLCTPRAGT